MSLVGSGGAVPADVLALIAGACRDHERLRFRYRSHDRTPSRRIVEPHRLVHLGRRWYLLAWDVNREDWRTFRVDRLTTPASTGRRFKPHALPAKDAATFVEQSITAAPSRFEAVVTLHAPAEEITSRISPQWGTITPVDAHTCEYRTGDDHVHWLALRIAMLGVDFDVSAIFPADGTGGAGFDTKKLLDSVKGRFGEY